MADGHNVPERKPLPPTEPHPQGQPQSQPVIRTGEWSNGFWDCFSPTSTCLVGWCCPCFLFGKTQSRLRDPALKDGSYANGDCCIFALLMYCGCSCIYLMIKRGELRERFGIEGSTMNDCLSSCCCPCCTLIQQEKEVDVRANNLQLHQNGYQAPQGMSYP